MKINRKSVYIFILLAILFASGLAIRRAVLVAQYEYYGRPLPFDLESALIFRYVRMLATTGALPVVDKYVQYPGGVNVKQTYEIFSEYICAGLARFFPKAVPLDECVRWISAAWFCLGIPALFLWIWWWQRSLWGAALGGAYYAFSLASVIRSTGQELAHENFALPLLIAYLALSALAPRETRRWAFVGLCALAALLLAVALMIWDLIQFYVIIWALLGFVRAARGDYFRSSRQRLKWGLVLAALVLAGLLNSYLRAHGFLYSPAMLLAYGALLAMCFDWFVIPATRLRRDASPRREAGIQEKDLRDSRLHGNDRRGLLPPDLKHWVAMLLRIGLALLPVLIGFFLCQKYAQSYNHFTELVYAKILFLNVKPADPALLSFAQRILWVPALNSASFLLTGTLFPVILPLFLISAVIFLFNPHWRTDPEITGLLFFNCMSLIAFIMFVRLHVFAAVGFSASIGLLGAWTLQRRNILVRILVVFLLLGGLAAEAANVLRDPLRWGHHQAYLEQKQELVHWLKANAPGQPILANFGISAFALAYADCPIILHPKFESPEIRKRVQEYGEMLFKADENRFRLWADQFGAAFYVYALGEFAPFHPEAQMRYFVDALKPPPQASARLFEFNPSASRWFVLLWQNPKYRVFRIVTVADERTAMLKARDARLKIAGGLLDQAKIEAEHALLYDPGNKNAQGAMLQINALQRAKRALKK